MSKFRSKNLKASLMSCTCTLFSDKVRCFNQSERALYGNFIIKINISATCVSHLSAVDQLKKYHNTLLLLLKPVKRLRRRPFCFLSSCPKLVLKKWHIGSDIFQLEFLAREFELFPTELTYRRRGLYLSFKWQLTGIFR